MVEVAVEGVFLVLGAWIVSTVHPNFDELTVVAVFLVSKDLGELAHVVLIVWLALAVVWAVHVPEGEVEADVHVVLGRALGEFLENVDGFAELLSGFDPVLTGVDLVLRVFGVEVAEAVVVLGGEKNALEVGFLESLDPLVGVEACWVEGLLVFSSSTPLAAGECVHTEMDESGELFAVEAQLLWARSRRKWSWRVDAEPNRRKDGE